MSESECPDHAACAAEVKDTTEDLVQIIGRFLCTALHGKCHERSAAITLGVLNGLAGVAEAGIRLYQHPEASEIDTAMHRDTVAMVHLLSLRMCLQDRNDYSDVQELARADFFKLFGRPPEQFDRPMLLPWSDMWAFSHQTRQ
jgi:hypothetical protein